jgi:hypothetical protein
MKGDFQMSFFSKAKPTTPWTPREFARRLDSLIAEARAAGLAANVITEQLDGRLDVLRFAIASTAPVDVKIF